MRKAGYPLSRATILQEVWGYGLTHSIDTRVVDVQISKLRKKIETNIHDPEFILTVRNVGYMFQQPSLKEYVNYNH